MSAAFEQERRYALTNSVRDEAGRRFTATSSNSLSDRSRSFSTVVTLDVSALRHADPVALLLGPVVEISALQPQRALLGFILSELYCNALEHGVLGLDSRYKGDAQGFERYIAAREEKLARLRHGWVRIRLRCSYRTQEGVATIRVDDSGAGFDCTRLSVAGGIGHGSTSLRRRRFCTAEASR